MLGDVRARKYSKTSARTRSILEKFAFDTTLLCIKLGFNLSFTRSQEKLGIILLVFIYGHALKRIQSRFKKINKLTHSRTFEKVGFMV